MANEKNKQADKVAEKKQDLPPVTDEGEKSVSDSITDPPVTDEAKSITTSGLAIGGVHKPAVSKTVIFKVSYPEGYKGEKLMLDGSEQEVAPDTAAYFENLGIGKIVQ